LGHGSYLPLELCSTELKHKKKLTERETADIIKETAVPPARRAQYIEGWINNSGIGKDPILNEFGAQLSLKMVEVNGRVIPAPDIEYSAAFKNRVSSYKIAEKGFWDHTGFKFRNAKAVSRWVVLNHSNRVKEHALNQFIDKFISIGNEHGMDIADPLDVKTTFSANDMRFKEMLNNLVKANTLKSTSLDLILVVLGGSSNAYEILKTCCDLEFGVATQAVKEKNVEKLSDQTISNILLKVNTKLSGRNFIVAKDDPK
jgi:eukaryotic translation initiation factor 2C